MRPSAGEAAAGGHGGTVVVTGAGGFLGRYLCEALAARATRTVGTVRSAVADQVPGVAYRHAELGDQASLEAALAGADAVVANAGLVFSRSEAAYRDANLAGLDNLIAAAVAAGVRRLVLVSTVSVYRPGPGLIGEDHPTVEFTSASLARDPYAATKAQAERVALGAAGERGLAVTVLRPSYIYGRGARFMGTMRRYLTLPVALVPRYMRIPLAYAGDVAAAVAACALRPPPRQVYNLAGRHDTDWGAFARAWEEAGGPVSRFRLPLPRSARVAYDTSRAETDLGWRNTDFAAALREVFAAP